MSLRPIKIVRILDRLNIGGPAIHALLLNRYFNSNGTWESILTYGQEGPAEGTMLNAHENVSTLRFLPSLGRELHPIRDLVSFIKVVQLIRQERPSIVHTHKSKAGVIGRLAARACHVPVIVHTYHGHVLHGYFGLFKTRLFIFIERWMATMTDHVITVSPKVKAELVRYGIATEKKIKVIYLGLDLKKFAIKNRNEGTYRRDRRLDPNLPLIGIVARLVPIKRINLFLQVAHILLKKVPNSQFVVIGDGELRLALEQQSIELGLQDHIHFTGFRLDVENIYPDLDVLALTSANEGSPVSLIEGLASGCAVVATDVGGIADVIRADETGLLVPSKSYTEETIAQMMADKIYALLQDPAMRKAIGAKGKEDILSRFSIERLGSDLSELYQQSLSHKVL
jgi:glycosyltransferase involved in cell wall biosynthesis